ncbi:unnamed protein product [Cylicocyclus nassatus]|uniref:glutathione transferase n=1 Tax=Cylicocyclus nassatus TaxID=53992 RepID=A0AA36H8L4_CYLNA|nr:unnamed protein product [Cylicocyclus nassatus]
MPKADEASTTSEMNDEERMVHKLWEWLLDIKEDVKRQQQGTQIQNQPWSITSLPISTGVAWANAHASSSLWLTRNTTTFALRKRHFQRLSLSSHLDTRKFGFAGKTPFEEALVDSLADQYSDYRVEIKPFVYTAYGFDKKGDLATLKKEVMLPARDKFLGFITKFLKKSKSEFLVGDSVTWVDLLIAEHCSDIQSKVPEYLTRFPEVKVHMEKVRSIPKLKKWIETRPASDI